MKRWLNIHRWRLVVSGSFLLGEENGLMPHVNVFKTVDVKVDLEKCDGGSSVSSCSKFTGEIVPRFDGIALVGSLIEDGLPIFDQEDVHVLAFDSAQCFRVICEVTVSLVEVGLPW